MTNRIVGRFLIVSVLLGAASAVASAQVPAGTINGIVSDPHDAIVANAHLVAISKAQGTTNSKSKPLDLPPLNSRKLWFRRAAQLRSTPGCRSWASAQRSP